VEVAVSLAPPILEIDPELEGALRLPDELVLVDLQHAVEGGHLWDGRLADTDDSDLVGLDEHDLAKLGRQDLREGSGGHPSGGAAADDHDLADTAVAQFMLLRMADPRGAAA
jgi:hypothetical protein